VTFSRYCSLSCNSRIARVSLALYVKGRQEKEEEVTKRKRRVAIAVRWARPVQGDEMDRRKEMVDESPKEKREDSNGKKGKWQAFDQHQ
jgi:hypothetical protein